MKLRKYIDTTDSGAEFEILEHLANGWYFIHEGLILLIMEKEV